MFKDSKFTTLDILIHYHIHFYEAVQNLCYASFLQEDPETEKNTVSQLNKTHCVHS